MPMGLRTVDGATHPAENAFDVNAEGEHVTAKGTLIALLLTKIDAPIYEKQIKIMEG